MKRSLTYNLWIEGGRVGLTDGDVLISPIFHGKYELEGQVGTLVVIAEENDSRHVNNTQGLLSSPPTSSSGRRLTLKLTRPKAPIINQSIYFIFFTSIPWRLPVATPLLRRRGLMRPGP